jgi:hypothetical protein
MYQIPIAAHEAWKQPWCIRLRVAPSTVKAASEYRTAQQGDVNGVV